MSNRELVLENARRFSRAGAPSLGFMPVETARGTVYFPMRRCPSGHWWFTDMVGCETCAKIEMDVRDAADDRWLSERLEAEADFVE